MSTLMRFNCSVECRVSRGKAIAIGADVTKAADVENYVRTTVGSFGRIDCFSTTHRRADSAHRRVRYGRFRTSHGCKRARCFLGLRYVIPVMLEQGTAHYQHRFVAGMVGSPGMSAYVA